MYVNREPLQFSFADSRLLVFPNIFDQSIQFSPTSVRPGASTSTYKRTADASNYHFIQRLDHREAYHIFRP